MRPITQRPKNLGDVADRAVSLDSWGLALSDLLDEIACRRENRIEIESCVRTPPPLLRGKFQDGDIADAFAAALAEYVTSEQIGVPPPSWVSEPERFLIEPWYPDESPRIREYLAKAAPRAFRVHGIFIDLDSLVRV
jgi:hypothetical protein